MMKFCERNFLIQNANVLVQNSVDDHIFGDFLNNGPCIFYHACVHDSSTNIIWVIYVVEQRMVIYCLANIKKFKQITSYFKLLTQKKFKNIVCLFLVFQKQQPILFCLNFVMNF